MDLSVLNRALDIKMGKAGLSKAGSNLQPEGGESVAELEVDKIKPDPNQPRKTFNAEDIQALADDIKSHGLIQPIIVRTDGIGQYIVVAGERRLKAFQLLKEPKIKAIIRNDYAADKLGFIQIAENIKRADLKFYELAEFIVQKIDAGMKQVTLADELGMTKHTVMQYASWKDAPEFLKEAKEKFSSIRAFYDLVNLAQEHQAEVEEFVSSCGDRVTSAAVTAFKKRLNGEEPEAEAQETVPQAEEQPQDSEPADSADAAQSAGEADALEDGADNAGAEETQSDDSFAEAEDEAGAAFDAGAGAESVSAEDGESQNDFDEAAEPPAGDSADSSFDDELQGTDTADDQSAALEDAADAMLESADGEDKLKRPLIIGSVEGREGYLMFKHRPTAEGMVWVKWDDGFEEEIVAESFRINRIIEE